MGELIVVLAFVLSISLFVGYLDSDFFTDLSIFWKICSIAIIVLVAIFVLACIMGTEKAAVETIFGTIYIPSIALGIFALLSPFTIVLYLIPISVIIAIAKWIKKSFDKTHKNRD